MANNINGNPWVIDTAAVIMTDPVHVKRMTWQEPTAADDLTIVDNAGGTIWDENALAGGAGIAYDKEVGILANGFNLSVIDGGTLYVYIR